MNNCCLIILILLFCSNGSTWGLSRGCNSDYSRERSCDSDFGRDRDCDNDYGRERDSGRNSRMVYPSYSGGSTCGCDDSENQG